ncbi:MAG TPA: RNA polymerase subunit sigma-70 [Polyangia bacterium]
MNDDAQLLAAARSGDQASFEQLVAKHRRELHAHCYRMLGSPADADDALQESLLAAWRGLAGFEGRSSLRTWLYQVTTNATLRLISRSPARLLSPDHGPPRTDPTDLGEPVAGRAWLEPLRTDDDRPGGGPPSGDDPAARYLRRESVELAFVAALQHLPGTQRAVLILREVLELSAEEVADLLESTVASVNSALQRARKAVSERVPTRSQEAELRDLGTEGERGLVAAFVAAWERADASALLQLLTEDARLTMPPLPAWFSGRENLRKFFAERMFAMPWRLVPLRANGQPGFACYVRQPGGGRFQLGAVNVLSLRGGRVAWIAAFLDPAMYRSFGLPTELADENRHPDR